MARRLVVYILLVTANWLRGHGAPDYGRAYKQK